MTAFSLTSTPWIRLIFLHCRNMMFSFRSDLSLQFQLDCKSLLYVAEVNKYHESLPATTLFYTPSVKHTNPLFMVTQQTDTTVILGSFIGHHRWGTTAHSPNPCFRLTNRESLSQLVLEIPRLVLLTKKKTTRKSVFRTWNFSSVTTQLLVTVLHNQKALGPLLFSLSFSIFSPGRWIPN